MLLGYKIKRYFIIQLNEFRCFFFNSVLEAVVSIPAVCSPTVGYCNNIRTAASNIRKLALVEDYCEIQLTGVLHGIAFQIYLMVSVSFS